MAVPNPQHSGPPAARRRGRPSTVDRQAVLGATLQVIARRGLDRARYVDIAEECGVATSTLQHAFGRLDEILVAALDLAHEREAQFLATLPSAQESDPWARIEALVDGAVGPFPGGQPSIPATDSWLVWVELWRGAARDRAIADRAAQQYELWWQTTEAIVRDGQEAGVFTTALPARTLTVSINALIDGVAMGMLMREDAPGLDEARRTVLAAVGRLLRA